MKRAVLQIPLHSGDVASLAIIRTTSGLKLAVHDDRDDIPLIQAVLSPAESRSLVRALAGKIRRWSGRHSPPRRFR